MFFEYKLFSPQSHPRCRYRSWQISASAHISQLAVHTSLVTKWHEGYKMMTELCRRKTTRGSSIPQRHESRVCVYVFVWVCVGASDAARPYVTRMLSEHACKHESTLTNTHTESSGPLAVDAGGAIKRATWWTMWKEWGSLRSCSAGSLSTVCVCVCMCVKCAVGLSTSASLEIYAAVVQSRSEIMWLWGKIHVKAH